MASRKRPKVRKDEYQQAMKRALTRKSLLQTDGKYLTRDQVHDREQLREKK